MRSIIASSVLAVGTALTAWAQAPVEPLLAFRQDTKLPDPKQLPKDAKKDEKKAPPALPDVPPVTLPASTAPAPDRPLLSSGSQVQVSSLPPVYGDFFTGSTFNPYLVATAPNGTMTAVKPGVTADFPLGTTFDRSVQTQIVTIVTNETVVGPDGQVIVVPVRRQVVRVTGTPAVGSKGGMPVNVARGAFKIAENESPRPVDRVYATYNYFSDVNPTLSVPELPVTNVHRQTIGIEKTFLDGDASIGLRLPMIQINGPYNLQAQSMGDLSVVLKYAWINDYAQTDGGPLQAGNVLSGGLVITAPTGNTAAYSADCPIIHSTLLQPWVGGILVRGDAFLQGFSSIVVPTDSRDTTYIFNSFQLGYMLWQAPTNDRLLTSFSPIVECHISNPLDNRGLQRLPIGATDIVSLTGGATFGLGSRSFLNLGANTPVTGPQPYVVEAVAQLNIRY